MQNKKKGIYNIVFGLTGQLITICLGVLIPRLVLVQYGSEVNGLLNAVNQIFIYASLLEAGVGTASMQALYKPIAENNRYEINRILSATNCYYKKTSFVYFFVVLFFAIAYPFVVESEISRITVFFVFFFHGYGKCYKFWDSGKISFIFRGRRKKLYSCFC